MTVSRSSIPGLRSLAFAVAAIAAAPLGAQVQVQAYYPLATDLLDATNTYGPMLLRGSPAPSAPNNGVCANGIYYYSPGGQDIRTPLLPSLDTTDFEIDFQFQITAMPTFQGPVLMGGDLWRWLGVYLQSSGLVGVKFNNSQFTWSNTALVTGQWYTAALKYEGGTVVLSIDGAIIHHAAIGALVDGNNRNVTTNDFSNGQAFNGCIRNLLIANNTSVLAAATAYGTGCAGSAGVPALAPTTLPLLGTAFQMTASNLPPAGGFAVLAVGFSRTNWALGPLPFSLVPFGLAAGCDLLVSPDATLLVPNSGGSAALAIGVPSGLSFVGQALYFQVAPLDAGAVGGVAVSNAVAASIGF